MEGFCFLTNRLSLVSDDHLLAQNFSPILLKQRTPPSGLDYLNAGKGNPCAGQTRAICERLSCKKVELFSEVANFGAELPTGSENYWVLIINTFSLT